METPTRGASASMIRPRWFYVGRPDNLAFIIARGRASMILAEQIEFVKDQQGYHERQVAKAANKGEGSRLHQKLLTGFAHVLDSLERLASLPPTVSDQIPDPSAGTDEALAAVLANPTQVNPAILEGLPPALLDQLAISETDRFQWQVVDLINRTPDKIISIEVLLIALYRASGKVLERTELSNRIYRMTRKRMVFSVPGKKGWYTTLPTDELQLDLEDAEEGPEAQK